MSRTWIELDLNVLAENIRAVISAAAGAEVIPVVKSDAYNHGLAPVTAEAWKCGIRSFVVGDINEGAILREHLPQSRILLVGAVEPKDVADVAGLKLIPIIFSEPEARAVSEAALRVGAVVECHIKVDTGMGRMGLPWERAAGILEEIARLRGLRITGLCTHFASGPADGDFASEQAGRFQEVTAQVEQRGLRGLFRHAANSSVFREVCAWNFDGVRPGILLYGYGGAGRREIKTRPFLQWKSRLIQIKDVPAGFRVSYDSTFVTPHRTRLGTVDVGYADGFSRILSNRGFILAGGRRCPVAGRVTMNYIVADLGPNSPAREGDEVVLIGRQGGEAIWADEIAAWRGTIAYEVLTNISTRDRRIIASLLARPA